jgi:hypothetical protein
MEKEGKELLPPTAFKYTTIYKSPMTSFPTSTITEPTFEASEIPSEVKDREILVINSPWKGEFRTFRKFIRIS